jgi:glycosyltransferase involved in cell wall biosynthesis
MRILHAGKFYAPVAGGIETVLATLCEATADRWEVRAVVANQGRQTVRERRHGVDVVRVGTLARALSVSLSPGLARALWGQPADCVVLHEPNPLVGTLLAIHRPAGRFIVWHHSDIVRPAWANPTYGRLQRAMYRRADCVIVAAPPLAEHSAAVRAARRVEVIPYGVADPDPALTWLDPTGAVVRAVARLPEPRVLYVGRLVYYKGLDVLLRAMTLTDGALVIVGDGPLDGTLRRQIARLGLGDRVVLLGRRTDAEVRGLYQRCDVFVLPSTARTEAFGLVQVEAMLSGVPVISTDLPTGVPWVNEHGVTGLIVPPGDAAALAAALRRLLEDAPLRAKLGDTARERARERFGQARMVERFVEVVESVVHA